MAEDVEEIDDALESDASVPKEAAEDGEMLSVGDAATDQFDGMTISTPGHSFGAMLFDSSNPTGDDSDLATDQEGLVLIISGDGDSSDPDDKAGGGTIRFDFDELVGVHRVGLLDIEEGRGSVKAFNSENALIKSVSIPGLGDNSLQQVEVNAENVAYLEIRLTGSGAITNLDTAAKSFNFETVSGVDAGTHPLGGNDGSSIG